MSDRPHYADLQVSSYEIGLTRLLGKGIAEVRGYLSEETGEPTFKLTKLVLSDGTFLGIEGEHDFPYLVTYGREPQPHFDAETFQALLAEAKREEGA